MPTAEMTVDFENLLRLSKSETHIPVVPNVDEEIRLEGIDRLRSIQILRTRRTATRKVGQAKDDAWSCHPQRCIGWNHGIKTERSVFQENAVCLNVVEEILTEVIEGELCEC